jgi:hypothetical protein
MGGFVFCDLPHIDATTSAGRTMLTMIASVAEFEARRISERTREALAAAKARSVKLGSYREGAARQSAARRSQAVAEAEQLRGVLPPMVAAGMSDRAMAQALAKSAAPAGPWLLPRSCASCSGWAWWESHRAVTCGWSLPDARQTDAEGCAEPPCCP